MGISCVCVVIGLTLSLVLFDLDCWLLTFSGLPFRCRWVVELFDFLCGSLCLDILVCFVFAMLGVGFGYCVLCSYVKLLCLRYVGLRVSWVGVF